MAGSASNVLSSLKVMIEGDEIIEIDSIRKTMIVISRSGRYDYSEDITRSSFMEYIIVFPIYPANVRNSKGGYYFSNELRKGRNR